MNNIFKIQNRKFYISLFFFGLACNFKMPEQKNIVSSPSKLTIFVDSLFDSQQKRDTAVAYVLLPNAGCEGCITDTEKMLHNFISNKYPVNFILTKVLSLKVLRLKLGDSTINNSKVFIDTTNVVYGRFPDINMIYPAVIYPNVKNPKDMIQYIQPENPDAIKNLTNFASGGYKKQYAMLNLYKEVGDSKSATIVARRIVEMPVKIASLEVDIIKRESSKYLVDVKQSN